MSLLIRALARRMPRGLQVGRTIRGHLFGLVAAVALPLTALSGYMLYADIENHLQRETEYAKLQARYAAASVTHLLGQTRVALEGLATRRAQLLDPAVCKPAAVALVELDPLYTNLVVRDHLERTVCAALPGQGAPAMAFDQDSFRRALDEKRFVVGAPLLGPISKRWVAIARQPLLDAQGAAIGVINLPIDLQNLGAAIARLESPFVGTILLVGRDGVVLARVPDDGQWIGRNLRDMGAAAAAITAGQDQVTGPGADGIERVYGIAAVPATDWLIAAGIPTATIIAPIRRRALQGAAVMLGSLALIALLSVAVARAISRPIRALAQTAHDVETGHADARALAQGPAEVAAVAQQVNRMLDAQQAALDALRDSELALRASHERFESVFRAAPLPMSIADEEAATLLDVNDAFCELFGFAREEMVGRSSLALDTWVDPTERDRLAQRLQADGRVREFPTQRRLRSGEVREIQVNVDHITLDGQTRSLATLLDVTLRNRAEKVLLKATEMRAAAHHAKQADKLKTAFLATMSHELRTPLNSIVGFTGVLLQGLAGPLTPEQTKQLGMVQRSSRHLLALVNDVLDVAKIEAGALTLRAAPFDAGASVAKVVGLVTPLAKEKGLALRIEHDGDLGSIVGDARRVEQILFNLLGNAVKFTEAGTITIRARRQDEHCCIEVADTGMGIAAADFARVFEAFQQVETEVTTRYQDGTGLGLAVSQGLARLMGGDIKVRSRLGEGSVFTLNLPVASTAVP